MDVHDVQYTLSSVVCDPAMDEQRTHWIIAVKN